MLLMSDRCPAEGGGSLEELASVFSPFDLLFLWGGVGGLRIQGLHIWRKHSK